MCLPQNNVKLSSPWKVGNTSKGSFTYMKMEAFDTSQILVGRRKSVLARKSMHQTAVSQRSVNAGATM